MGHQKRVQNVLARFGVTKNSKEEIAREFDIDEPQYCTSPKLKTSPSHAQY